MLRDSLHACVCVCVPSQALAGLFEMLKTVLSVCLQQPVSNLPQGESICHDGGVAAVAVAAFCFDAFFLFCFFSRLFYR